MRVRDGDDDVVVAAVAIFACRCVIGGSDDSCAG